MAFIQIKDFEELDEPVQQKLEMMKQMSGRVGEIALILATRGDIFDTTMMMAKTLLMAETELPFSVKESIALLVSLENSCTMCVDEHKRLAKAMGMDEDQIANVLQGVDAMDVSKEVKTLLRYCLKAASKENYKIVQDDVDAVKKAGFTDSQILEAVAVSGYFNYANTISNALGAGK